MPEQPRPWGPLVRAVALLAAFAAALLATGWVRLGIVGAWALVDALVVLAVACRRYDEDEPWVVAFFEGVIQVVVATFVWVWWGTGPSAFGGTLALALAVLAVVVLGAGVRALWADDPDGRVPPAAVAALVLVVMAMAGGPGAASAFAVVLTTYMGAFVLTAAVGSYQLARSVPGGVRRLLAPNAWASIAGAVALVVVLAALGARV
jgi:hypothetical protein